jgi:TRAP transporter TAXI family solute receptor
MFDVFVSKAIAPICLAAVLATSSFANGISTGRAEINRGTVGIVAGSVEGTYSRFAQDISDVIDQIGDVRVLAILGKGSVQNILDLLYLRGVDLAIVQSDVLQAMTMEEAPVRDIRDRVRYVTKLYNEEVHIVARREIGSIKELSGRRVSVDNALSGTNMTARLLFGVLDIPVEFVNQPTAEARAALLRGDIDALVYVAGKPVSAFASLRETDRLHLLPIELEKELDAAGYLGGRFTSGNYPALVSAEIPTISVGAVLAVYNWPEDANPSSRYQKTARVVREILEALPLLQDGLYHEKWSEVDPSSEVGSWTRFKPVQEWLGANRGDAL